MFLVFSVVADLAGVVLGEIIDEMFYTAWLVEQHAFLLWAQCE